MVTPPTVHVLAGVSWLQLQKSLGADRCANVLIGISRALLAISSQRSRTATWIFAASLASGPLCGRGRLQGRLCRAQQPLTCCASTYNCLEAICWQPTPCTLLYQSYLAMKAYMEKQQGTNRQTAVHVHIGLPGEKMVTGQNQQSVVLSNSLIPHRDGVSAQAVHAGRKADRDGRVEGFQGRDWASGDQQPAGASGRRFMAQG